VGLPEVHINMAVSVERRDELIAMIGGSRGELFRPSQVKLNAFERAWKIHVFVSWVRFILPGGTY
jgi:hypothetical protein